MSVAFEPIAFLHLAQQLMQPGGSTFAPSAAASEARVRTTLGRTYYALYLLVRREISRRHGILYRPAARNRVHPAPVAPRCGKRLTTSSIPAEPWREHLTDEVQALALAQLAMELAVLLPRLDFAPVVPLLKPGGPATQPAAQ